MVTEADAQAFVDWLQTHCAGRAAAKTARQLQALGCQSSDRDLRALREAALEYGLLVCADNAGYFIPATRDEADEAIGRLRSQGLSMLQQAGRLEKMADRAFAAATGNELFAPLEG